MKMALRLRRDVQKALYYVWFLGAQEARGLRGPRVVFPAVPRLLERSRSQEPLKVTLQVSHKGLKIVQGNAKHFIPHGAITCSMQNGDIVACVLLLYNPATRCPLHVHAYRCDSESTAEALHNQLQILVNRPENQRRFAELETRLGLNNQPSSPVTSIPPVQTRKFESSLGSDTGTSTRESDCSEEHVTSQPPTSLYDSLAAELRQKLSGGGPPLLLPPRDYDTVHRSKGNLAATELRRCRTSSIVGPPGQTGSMGPVSPQGVSSRGSSGFGSDLAPSPERTDHHSSSDEEWNNEMEPTVFMMHEPTRRISGGSRPFKSFEGDRYRDEPTRKPTSPVREPPREEPNRYRHSTSSSKINKDGRYELDRKIERDNYAARSRYEKYPTPKYREDVIPCKDVNDYREEELRYKMERERYGRYRDDGGRFSAEIPGSFKDLYIEDDKKYREESLRYHDENGHYHENVSPKYREDKPKYREDNSKYREFRENLPVYREDALKHREEIREPTKYRDEMPTYHEKNQKFVQPKDNFRERYREEIVENRRPAEDRQRSVSSQRQSQAQSPNPLSPRDRFKDAKEKFQNLERARTQEMEARNKRVEQSRSWSSEEDDTHNARSGVRRPENSSNRGPSSPGGYRNQKAYGYGELTSRERHPGLDRLPPSKSLGNLNTGYRHSYAEPIRRHPIAAPISNKEGLIRPSVINRVGLAAVHHY